MYWQIEVGPAIRVAEMGRGPLPVPIGAVLIAMITAIFVETALSKTEAEINLAGAIRETVVQGTRKIGIRGQGPEKVPQKVQGMVHSQIRELVR